MADLVSVTAMTRQTTVHLSEIFGRSWLDLPVFFFSGFCDMGQIRFLLSQVPFMAMPYARPHFFGTGRLA